MGGVWGSVGYFFGNRLGEIVTVFKGYEFYFIVGVVVLIALALAYHLLKRRKEDIG